MDAKKKDESMEILRGWAILGVLLVHTSMYFKYSKDNDILVLINIIIDIVAHVAVPLFIFISGFVLARNYSVPLNYGQFYKKRFNSVLTQYLLISCLYLFYFSIYKSEHLSLVSMIKSIITFDASFHLWFFKALFGLYLFYPVIRRIYEHFILRSHYMRLLFLAVSLQIIWTFADTLLSKNIFVSMMLMGTTFLGWIVYFVIGMLAYSYKDTLLQLANKNSGKMLAFMLLILILVSVAWIDAYFGEKNQSLTFARLVLEPVLFVSMIAYLFAMSNTRYNSSSILKNLLLNLGNYAFGVYLIHVFYLHIFVNFIAPFLRIGMSSGSFYIALFLFMTILSVLTVSIIARIPFYHLLIGKLSRKSLITS